MKTAFIYTLTDPRDGLIKYVGKTVNLGSRYSDHTHCFPRSICGNWLLSLARLGLKPIMEVIDETKGDDWEWLEIYWIAQFRAWGFSLKNGTEGGAGIDSRTCSKHSKGRSLSNEHKERLRTLRLGTNLTQEHKENIGSGISRTRRNINSKKFNKVLNQYSKDTHEYIASYGSIVEASEKTGFNRSGIASTANPNNRIKSAMGYIWKWEILSK